MLSLWQDFTNVAVVDNQGNIISNTGGSSTSSSNVTTTPSSSTTSSLLPQRHRDPVQLLRSYLVRILMEGRRLASSQQIRECTCCGPVFVLEFCPTESMDLPRASPSSCISTSILSFGHRYLMQNLSAIS